MANKDKKTTVATVVFVLVGAVCLGLIFGAAISNYPKITGHATQTGYEEKSCVEVQIPYSETEYYTEKEPYADEKCEWKDYNYMTEKRDHHYWSVSDPTCWVRAEISNYEDIGGAFNAKTSFEVVGPDFEYDKDTWISAHSRKTIVARYNCDMTEDIALRYLTIAPPEKRVCTPFTNYRDVRKSRTVTKYRTETQCD